VTSNEVRCDDSGEWVCPQGTVCEQAHHLCVTQADLDLCAGKAENTECGSDPVSGQAQYCSMGLCITAACGDGLVAGLEQCDDGNGITGDGCSAGCLIEGCGNGIVDPVHVFDDGHVEPAEDCDDGGFLDHDGCSSTCKAETPQWTQHFTTLDPRAWPAIAYDARRDRIVAFGGEVYGATTYNSGETLEWNGRDWIRRGVPGPPARFAASMVYDSDRHEIVLFGGEIGNNATGATNTYLDDMWRWDGLAWTQVFLDERPPPRSRATMAYDPQRHVIVLYGGKAYDKANQSVDLRSDTWEFDGTAWTKIADDSPPGARENAGVAYDPSLGGVVIVGGDMYSMGTVLSDTWLYRDQNWQQLAASLPTQPTTGLGVSYDIAAQRLIAFGGNTEAGYAPSGGTAQTATLVWTDTGWSVATVTPPAAARAYVGVAASRHHVIAFGGRSAAGTGSTETVILTPTTGWTAAAALGARFAMGAANLPERASAIVFGGQTAGPGSESAETYELTPDGFALASGAGPSARSFPGMAYDPANHDVVLFGGTPGPSSQTWTWNGAWTSFGSSTPPGRYEPQIAFDGQQVCMVGGYGSGGPLDDVWGWNGSSWSALPFAPPSTLFGAAAGYDPSVDQMVVAGGRTVLGSNVNDDSFTVTSGALGEAPSLPVATYGPSLVWNPARQKLTLLGGNVETTMTAKELDRTNERWDVVPVVAAPRGRIYTAAIASIDGSGILVMSGSTNPGLLDDSWELSWQGPGVNELCGADDTDGDGLVGCADPDCWWVCTPSCPPGTEATCDQTGPRCGDAGCEAPRESCATCPGDCGACNLCGDGVCDSGETCAGDCP
jgi:cysteine-rich repeat protein